MSDPSILLASLRWGPDQMIVNHFGESVWLRKIEDGSGITDCCLVSEPCPDHAGLTNSAPRDTQ